MTRIALRDLKGQRVDLIGLGIDVSALLSDLTDVAESVAAWVDRPDQISEAEATACQQGNVPVGPVNEWDGSAPFAIRAPGFPRYRADIADRLKGVAVSTPVDLWLNTYGADHPTVIVTGTKGKSTVTTMLHALLEGSAIAGNIGVPIWSLSPDEPRQTIICELSSYQGADTQAVVDLAVLTSLSEDHVTWHGSVEQYHADKLKPVNNARRVLTHPEHLQALSTRAGEVRTVDASHHGRLAMPAHMAANAELAIAAAHWIREIYPDVIVVGDPVAVLNALPALPGRLRPVKSEFDDHRWYDDTLASNPSGAAAAVRAFSGEPIFLIVGGIDRNVDIQPLVDAVRDTVATGAAFSVATLPDNGPLIGKQLADACNGRIQLIDVGTVAEAVESARVYSDQSTVVLFSPAAPTPQRFGNWSVRSADFVAAVGAGAPFA